MSKRHEYPHGRDWAWTGHGYGRARHGRIVSERHGYPLNSLGLSVSDRAWEGLGWAHTGHEHRRDWARIGHRIGHGLGTGMSGLGTGELCLNVTGTHTGGTGHGTGHRHGRARHGRARHGRIVSERHGYPFNPLGLSVYDKAWEGVGWARIRHGRELGTHWARARAGLGMGTNWAQD